MMNRPPHKRESFSVDCGPWTADGSSLDCGRFLAVSANSAVNF